MSETLYWDKVLVVAQESVAAFPGVAGLALKDLKSGHSVAVAGDEPFPVASTIKIHLLAALLQLHDEGKLSLDERMHVPKTVPGSGVLSYLDDEVVLSWRDIANLMIIVSDNMATNMIFELIGFDYLNQFCSSRGLDATRIARLMQDQHAVAEGRENLSSPNDLVKLLDLLWNDRTFAPGVARECLRILKKPKKSFFAASLPPSVPLANKPGSMDRIRCDAGIVLLERRPFAMAVTTKYGSNEGHLQAQWVSDTARTMYDLITVLDATSMHGQGIVLQTPARTA